MQHYRQRAAQSIWFISNMFEAIGVLCLMLMMLHISIDVAAKYLLGRGLYGTTEIVSFWYMPVVVFLPFAAVERANRHVFIDLIDYVGGRRLRTVAHFVAIAVAVAFYALFTYVGWRAAEQKRAIGAFAMGSDAVLTWPAYYALPIGCMLIVLVLLLKLHPSPDASSWSEFVTSSKEYRK